MSTSNKHVHVTTKQQRMRIRRRNRTIRMILFFMMLCIIAVMTICHNKKVQALNEQIEELSTQISLMSAMNEDLTAAAQEAEFKLRLFVDPTQISAAGAVIYDIPLDAALQEYTYHMCVDYYIPEHYELVLAVMWQESNYDPEVISSSGDYGLLQINAMNHDWLTKELGVDDFLDPEQNIHAGVYLLAKLIHKYGDVSKALMAYNMGERGATTYWDSGTYSNAYSNSVIAKHAAIKMNNYGSN